MERETHSRPDDDDDYHFRTNVACTNAFTYYGLGRKRFGKYDRSPLLGKYLVNYVPTLDYQCSTSRVGLAEDFPAGRCP